MRLAFQMQVFVQVDNLASKDECSAAFNDLVILKMHGAKNRTIGHNQL